MLSFSMKTYLSLIPVVETRAHVLFDSMQNECSNYGLNLNICSGFANNGDGGKNSVWKIIQGISPECVQLKCICHSLALCIHHAFDKLPANPGFLLKEIPGWFSHSSLRRDKFKDIADTINSNTGAKSGKSQPLRSKRHHRQDG